MTDNSSEGSNSDMDLVEESEDEMNTTTYFHDDIKDSTDDDDVKESAEYDDIKESAEVDAILQSIQPTEDDYTEVTMDMVLSPVESRKSHLISCPVCFEISILKQPKLYNNIISACMEKSSNK